MSGPLLRDRDFRRLWIAGLIGYFIRWLEILVFGVFTYEHTRSVVLVTSVLMLRLVPLSLFGVPFGALAARASRRTVLICTLSTLFATSAILLIVASIGQLEVWHIAAASFINGAAWSGDNPMRRGLMGDIAGSARMGRAMALDVGGSNANRLAGPGIGGLMLAHAGMTSIFLLTAVLYVVALAAVLRIADRPVPSGAAATGVRATLTVGFDAARASPRLAGALWITIVFNIFGWPVLSLVPVIGQDRLHLAADGIGLLASVDGLGTLLGAFVIAAVSRPHLYGRIYVSGVTLFMGMLPFFASSTHPLTAAAALLMVGIGQSGFSIMQATIVFVATRPEHRVHAMGLLTMCIGIGPIGFLMLGWLAELVGPSPAAVISGLTGLAALAVTWPWWRPCWRDGGVDATGGRS